MALVGSFFVGAFIDPNVIAHFTRVLSPGVFFPIYKKRHLAKMDLRSLLPQLRFFKCAPRRYPHWPGFILLDHGLFSALSFAALVAALN